MIVTFSCQKDVFVYTGKDVKPMVPYKFHDTINAAKKYLKARGVKNIKVIKT